MYEKKLARVCASPAAKVTASGSMTGEWMMAGSDRQRRKSVPLPKGPMGRYLEGGGGEGS